MPRSSQFSTYNPLSLVDDNGLDATQGLPVQNATKNIGHWIASVNGETSSARSYIDDGADLLPPTRAGSIAQFGNVDSGYYRPKETFKRGYHPAVQKAVAGQISNTLHNIRVTGQFNIKEPDASLHNVRNAGPPPGAVRIHIPKKGPAYICHGKDGHVVVVDGHDATIDSRPTRGLRPVAPRESKKTIERPTSDIRPTATGNHLDQQWQQPPSQLRPENQQQQEGKGKKNKKGKKQEEGKKLSPIAEDHDDWGFGNSDDSWTEDLDQQKKTYKAPTVKDAPGTPDDILYNLGGFDDTWN